MAKSLTKLLATTAFLAAAAQGRLFQWLTDLDKSYAVGTELVLEWEPQARTGIFELSVASSLSKPVIISYGPTGFPIINASYMQLELEKAVPYTSSNFTWLVKPIDGRVGADWVYSFKAYMTDETGSSGSGIGAFVIQ